MVEYIYFVKCPNCEDEHFDFFDEAKAFALGCLSKKPVITQTEVCRNDFGECTDHSDLGTIWSWEDMMNDENMLEPEVSVFSKDNLKDYDPDNDPEFQDDDLFAINSDKLAVNDLNEAAKISFKSKEEQTEFADLTSKIGIKTGADLNRFMKDTGANDSNLLDKLRDYKADLGDDFEIKEDFVSPYDYDRMTKEELYDRLVTNKDIVEIEIGDQGYTLMDTGSFNDRGRYSDSYLSVEFSGDKFVATECYMSDDGDTKEGDCIIETDSFDELWDQLMAYGPGGLVEKCSKKDRKPIPDGMTIEQLVEEMEENEDTVECAWCEDLFDKSECRKEVNLGWLCGRCQAAIMSRGESLTFKEGNYWDFLDEKLDIDFSNCVSHSNHEIWGLRHEKDNIYKAFLIKRYENVSLRDSDACDKIHEEMYDIDGFCIFTFGKDGKPALSSWNVNLLQRLGSILIDFEDADYEMAVDKVFNRISETNSAVQQEDFDPEAVHDLGNEYDGGYPDKKPELPEKDEVGLKLCPECGEYAFDIETGICVECGFN